MVLSLSFSCFTCFAEEAQEESVESLNTRIVTEVQQALKAKGFAVGKIDGIYGKELAHAIECFQYESKMQITGELDKETYLKITGKDLPSRFSGSLNISLVRRIIADAMRLQGVPYVFGGTSPYGFDCSGFVQYVFRNAGIVLPRMADEQYYAARKVHAPKIGDMVFFSTYLPGVSHVGVYIGDNSFIHASSSRGVTISSLDDGYWSARYVGAATVL